MKFRTILTITFPILLHAIRGTSNHLKSCSACHHLVDTFLHGMSKTEKGNFNGGDTAWEEVNQGKYRTSEVRFYDVIDYVCKSFDGVSIDKDEENKCHSFMSDHEEDVESWYKYNQVSDFKTWLCIDTSKSCCPENAWGPNCELCPGNADRPCYGRGKCDGAGSRHGSGKCLCEKGYQGNVCRKCASGYYASFQNETNIDCEKCHIACRGGCSGPETLSCTNCKQGWRMVDSKGCEDVDECSVDDPKACTDSNEICENTVGSYTCKCKEGYNRENGACILDITNVTEDDDDDNDEDDHLEEDIKQEIDDEKETIEQEDVSEIPIDKTEPVEKEGVSIGPKPLAEEPSPPKETLVRSSDRPRPEDMSPEQRKKVRDHLKSVMDTLANLEKDRAAGKEPKRNFHYGDEKLNSMMDRLSKMKEGGGSYKDSGFHKVEL